MSYALIESFKGRHSPYTAKPVFVLMFRNFNPKTLQDTYRVELVSGSKHEVFENLTHNQAVAKYKSNCNWWQ